MREFFQDSQRKRIATRLAIMLVLLFISFETNKSNIFSGIYQPDGMWIPAEVSLIQEGCIPEKQPATKGPVLFGAGADSHEEAYAAICAGLQASESEIELSAYNLLDIETLKEIFSEAINDDSSLFYVTGEFIYYTVGGLITSIQPTYSMAGEELATAKAEYRNNIDAITSQVDSSWTQLEIALFLHDYLALHYEYDLSLTINKANEFFISGTGTCQAYTLAYQALLDEFSIARTRARSDAMNHIWNIVGIDGKWYHVDVTWDDPIPDMLGRCLHLHFLVSDEAIKDGERKHYEFEPDNMCNDNKYDDYFWKDVKTPIVYLDGLWYLIADSKLNSWTGDGDSMVSLLNFEWDSDFFWEVWDQPGWSWDGIYSGLGSYRDKLYFNSPTHIYAYDPSTEQSDKIYEADCSDGYIYGIRLKDNRVDYLISKGPNSEDMESAEIRSYEFPQIECGVRVKTFPAKTVYELGEAFDPTGLVVEILYEDGDPQTTTDFTITGDLSTPGERAITVTRGDFTDSLNVAVCGLSLEKQQEDEYKANFFLETSGAGTTFLVSGYSPNGRMKSVRMLHFERSGDFVSVQSTLTGLDGWTVLKVFFVDENFSPQTGRYMLGDFL